MPTETRSAALAWCGAVVSLLLILAASVNPFDQVMQSALTVAGLLLLIGFARRQPAVTLVSLLLLLAVVMLDGHGGATHRPVQLLLAAAIVALVGLAAAVRSVRFSVTATSLAAVGGLLITPLAEIDDLASFAVIQVLVIVTAWVVGNSIRQRAEFASAQRVQDEARAVQAERLRIARELHDMIAHSVGVIAIQAGAGRRVIDTQPAEARDALAAIEDTSRDTLAALRRMLGTLRRSDPGPEAVDYAPAPGLTDLGGLVARTREAGVQVRVEWRGSRDPLPPDVDLSAFRIVQEAVTNVIRHSGTQRCDVVVVRDAAGLTLAITDDGQGGPVAESGHGITGMRERVALLGGDFTAGPHPGGGFQVTARLPVPA
ncbi:sensor histidine kinase [Actinoplanes sp. G11-F43]|uniref:sensor histidine kinase n=1 Tax=Actinoplanes sp. G11-F43 TaxID=3424130 RepID=UPI003D343C70